MFKEVSGSSILVELEFGDIGFCERRKTGEPAKNPRSNAETNKKVNPHMAPG